MTDYIETHEIILESPIPRKFEEIHAYRRLMRRTDMSIAQGHLRTGGSRADIMVGVNVTRLEVEGFGDRKSTFGVLVGDLVGSIYTISPSGYAVEHILEGDRAGVLVLDGKLFPTSVMRTWEREYLMSPDAESVVQVVKSLYILTEPN